MPIVATPLTREPAHHALPLGPRLPLTLQTACCRWLPAWYFERCNVRLGDRFTIRAFDMPPLVFLSKPDDIHAVLTADASVLHPGPGAALISPLVGDRSFMLLDEEDHVRGRRAVAPAFHHSEICRHFPLVTEEIKRDVRSWPRDRVVRLDPLIRRLTLRIALRVIFGKELEDMQRLYACLDVMLTIALSLVLQEPKVRYLPGWRERWKVFIARRREVDAMIEQAIHDRRAEARTGHADLLDMLIASRQVDGSPMPHREIRDNLMSMLLAGHETTTGELAWAFQLLAHHKHVQERLSAEIVQADDDSYQRATINETMRRKPVFLFAIPRKVVTPIDIGGWTYGPPAHLVPCTYLMHHDPKFYRDPREFQPERFLNDPPQPRTFLPWGGGRKHCLGRHFALMEMKTILNQVLTHWALLPASKRIEHPRWRSAIVVPHAGCRVILQERRRRPRVG